MKIDFTRRRFIFGLAAAPLLVPVIKHFVMPALEWEPIYRNGLYRTGLPDPVWRKFNEGVAPISELSNRTITMREVSRDGGLTWRPAALDEPISIKPGQSAWSTG